MHVRTRRNKINIIKSVLLAVQEEVPKTRIMNSANLNHKSVTSYLSSLIDSGFIEMTENKTFIITQDGRNLLHKIQEYEDHMKNAKKAEQYIEQLLKKNPKRKQTRESLEASEVKLYQS